MYLVQNATFTESDWLEVTSILQATCCGSTSQLAVLVVTCDEALECFCLSISCQNERVVPRALYIDYLATCEKSAIILYDREELIDLFSGGLHGQLASFVGTTRVYHAVRPIIWCHQHGRVLEATRYFHYTKLRELTKRHNRWLEYKFGAQAQQAILVEAKYSRVVDLLTCSCCD